MSESLDILNDLTDTHVGTQDDEEEEELTTGEVLQRLKVQNKNE